MSDSQERLLIYFDEEQHIVRRLGAAVVSCWAELGDSLRAKLTERARQMLDDEESEALDEQIDRFVQSHLRAGGSADTPGRPC